MLPLCIHVEPPATPTARRRPGWAKGACEERGKQPAFLEGVRRIVLVLDEFMSFHELLLVDGGLFVPAQRGVCQPPTSLLDGWEVLVQGKPCVRGTAVPEPVWCRM